MIGISALAWIVTLVAAISGPLLVFLPAAGKVSASPLVAGPPASVVKFSGAGLTLLELSGAFVDCFKGTEADFMAVMKTSASSAEGIVLVADVAIPYPWHR